MQIATHLALSVAALGLTLGACSENPCAKRFCEVKTTVAYAIDFALEESEGVTRGFDLDDRVSPPRDGKTCGHGDMVDPKGNEGIDNNAAVLFESINKATEASVEELIRGSINDGRLLLTFQLFGLDDAENDDCVDVEIFQSTGAPVVGTDGYIVSGQTFDIDYERPRTSIKCAIVKDGVLRAGPFDGNLFVSIISVDVNLPLNSAKLSGTIGADGLRNVTLGAGIATSELHDILDQTNDQSLLSLGHFLIDSLADMATDKNGKCKQLSTTLVIEARSAYLF